MILHWFESVMCGCFVHCVELCLLIVHGNNLCAIYGVWKSVYVEGSESVCLVVLEAEQSYVYKKGLRTEGKCVSMHCMCMWCRCQAAMPNAWFSSVVASSAFLRALLL